MSGARARAHLRGRQRGSIGGLSSATDCTRWVGPRAPRPYTPRRMPYQLPPDPSTERRTRVTRWVSFAFAATLVALVAYFGYVGYEGSRQLIDPPSPSADCRTPATMGWTYEAINYDIATDAELAAEADPTSCSRQGALAGDGVTVGSIGLAGWYIPAANGAGPTAPTVVIVAWLGQQQERHARPRRLPPRRVQRRCCSTCATTGRAPTRRPPRACARPMTCVP